MKPAPLKKNAQHIPMIDIEAPHEITLVYEQTEAEQKEEKEEKEELVVSPSQHYTFCVVSLAILGTASYAVYRQMYVHAFLAYCIAFTSLNYWRHPLYGWRRNMDMLVLFIGLAYHSNTALYSSERTLYFSIAGAGILSYLLSVATHKYHSWLSCILHIVVHICANAANCLLYSSQIGNTGAPL